ncbi:MAG: hypothetical protein B6241_09280 [Spirochaetaceae bacterium 4572_59]|nr:MAG: hypothetical protein B6241_09280 [Spirochaetaceae bacterium 4572_59]
MRKTWHHHFEDKIATLIFLLLALLPTMEIFARLIFHSGLKSSEAYIRNAVVWLAFLAGMISSREKGHLSLTSDREILKGTIGKVLGSVVKILCGGISFGLALSSVSFLLIGFDPEQTVGLIPIRIVMLIMPVGFAVMGIRFLYTSGKLKSRVSTVLAALVFGLFLGIPALGNMAYTLLSEPPLFIDTLMSFYYDFFYYAAIPFIIVMILSAFIGTPIFILLGGVAYFLFSRNWGALEVLPNEAYNLLTGSTVPAIPLFTLTGFILSESKSGERLVRFFQSFMGGLPGGMAIMAVLVSAFFTTFTGASGVTILALGALLLYMLSETGEYSESFSQGLLTSSGSIGLLFPPSLPIIMYAVMAQISVRDMFLGGIIPGIILVSSLSVMGVLTAVRSHKKRDFFFNRMEFFQALKGASGELLLPIIILVGYFGGITTLVETGAVAVIYSIILLGFVHKEFKLKSLFSVMDKSLPIIGGVLMILATAKGLSYYLVDAEVPMMLTAFVGEHIHSRIVFLIILNLILLVTGCLMDIYSAILVVGPLIIPMGELFQIHPVQLGIIFLANLQLGYLTPPVGMNLFLASYRFETPLVKIYKRVVPFLLVLVVMVLLITYVPWFSLALLGF